MRVFGWLVVVTAATGCQCVSLPDVPFLCEPGECPGGQTCGADGVCVSADAGPPPDAGAPDAGPLDAAVPDAGLFDAGCTPVRSCSSAQAECGDLDTGCGVVFCGACATGSTCNVAQPNRCAPCVPAGPDEPDDAGVDSNCDGLDGIADGGVFVDPRLGADTNPGTREQPLKTLGAALERARVTASAHSVFVSDGDLRETVTWTTPVSIYGGYDAAMGWSRSAANTTTVSLGLIGVGLPAALVLDRVNVSKPTASTPSTATVAMVLREAPITLRNLTVTAEPGSAGDAGTSGAPGPSGGPGGPGGPGAAGRASCMIVGCVEATPSPGGAGGASACAPGEPGRSPRIGSPESNPAELFSALGCGMCPCLEADGGMARRVGGVGDAGASGDAGAPGEGSVFPGAPGIIIDAGWVGVVGGSGRRGEAGLPGGGGWFGGEARYAVRPQNGGVLWVVLGASGGGGGGGGCGGEGGAAGGPGGASIGLLVSGRPPRFDGVRIESRGGGPGGASGEGGEGGAGGPGGAGFPGWSANCGSGATTGFSLNTMVQGPTSGLSSGASGPGGAGGRGGRGGDGAPGAGGPAVGIWCETPTPSLDAGSVTFTVGSGGAGGRQSDGGLGPQGLTQAVFGCN